MVISLPIRHGSASPKFLCSSRKADSGFDGFTGILLDFGYKSFLISMTYLFFERLWS